jgi:hypothetical protein
MPEVMPAEAVTFEFRPLLPKIPFQQLVTSALDGRVEGWPADAGGHMALARRWWGQRPGPGGSKEVVWEELAAEGTRAEVASWSECGNLAWLQPLFGRLVVEHQCGQALLDQNDPLPAPWTATGIQAVAALWLIGRIAVAAAEGGAQGDAPRAPVTTWLDALPQTGAGWGDLLIFHRLAPVFATWVALLQPNIKKAEMELEAAKAVTKLRLEEEAKTRGRRLAAAKWRTKQAEYAETAAAGRLRRLHSARTWLHEAGGKWTTIDAIGKLPAFGDTGALPLPPPGRRVTGLEMWAVKEAAQRCPHTPTALVERHEAMRKVFGGRLGLDGPADTSDKPELWRNRRLALEIYRIWFGLLSCSSGGRPLFTLLARTSDEQLESYSRFFETWNSLDRARCVLSGVPSFGDRGEFQTAAAGVFREIGEQMETLRADLTDTCRGPLQAPEFATWGGDRQTWFAAQLAAIGLEGHVFDDAAWGRILELARFYRRWGEVTATPQEVRRAGLTGAGSATMRVLLLPWRRLQAASLAAQVLGPAATDVQREFLRVYDMPQWIRVKLDDLWGLLGSSQAATAGGAA